MVGCSEPESKEVRRADGAEIGVRWDSEKMRGQGHMGWRGMCEAWVVEYKGGVGGRQVGSGEGGLWWGGWRGEGS